MSWESVKLGSLIEVLSGFAFDSAKFNGSIGTPLIRIRDIKRSYTETLYNGEFDQKYLVRNGDVLIGMDGEFNVAEWTGKDALLNQRVCKIEIKDPKSIYLRYLLYYLPFELKLIEDKASFVTVKHLSVSDIKNIEIPLPPLATQKRIAEILDAADALRRKDQELLKKYDELAQAIFIDMFGDPVRNEKGWDKVELSHYIAHLETGVSVNSNDDKFDINKKCVLKTSCVYTGYFNSAEAKVIVPADLVRAKLNPVKDSIIISRMNTTELVGMSAYLDNDYPNLYLPDRLWMTVKSDNTHSSLWLSFALKSNAIREQILRIASGTSGSMKNISKKDFLQIKIINPPYKLQRTFQDALIKINALKKCEETKKGNILFNSLIQKAFKGELIA